MDLPLYQEAVCHFLSGIALSLADRLFSKNAKRHTKERVEGKLEQVTALHDLVEAEQRDDRVERRKGREYFEAVMRARGHFKERGKKVGRLGEEGRMSGIADFFRFCKESERINNLPLGEKLATSFGVEFVIDALVAVVQIMGGKVNALMALGESLYQGPSLFVGLLAGKGILSFKDLFRSKEEKELDDMAEELTRDGKLLELVRNYSPTEGLEPADRLPEKEEGGEAEEGTREGREEPAGKAGLTERFREGLDEIRKRLRERERKRAEEEEKRRKELGEKYEDY